MRLVVLESPYGADSDGQIRANIDYARACMRDCLFRGEFAFASHLLYTQPYILDDKIPTERRLGIEAQLAWIGVADAVVVYEDYGISEGMLEGIKYAKSIGQPVEYRTLSEHVIDRTA